jgi:hypothetical protein
MSGRPLNRFSHSHPEVFLSELLLKSVQGAYHDVGRNVPVFHRALVVAVDTEGGRLENPGAQGSVTHVVDGRDVDVSAIDGPRNPPNSVKARILTDGFDQFTSDERLRVFWPAETHSEHPIKPGEHVFVFFEGETYERGHWIGRVSANDDVNEAPGRDLYGKSRGDDLAAIFGDDASAGGSFDTEEKALEPPKGDRIVDLFGDT